jgi:5-methylcytosine-specific restriction endonuclease McrA
MPQNKEDILKKASVYRNKNKDKIRENNSDAINSYTACRRAKIKNQVGSNYLLSEEIRYRKICKYLSIRYSEPFELDHFVPLSRGGLHDPSNWQIITKQENLCKNNIPPITFYTSERGIWFLKNKKGIRIKISSING